LVIAKNQSGMEQTIAIKKRVMSIDVFRGIIMIIMALDHVRDFFHNDAMLHDPLNPAGTTPVLFFTRFITHFCAPNFVFLAGMSAYLSGRRKTKAQLSSFLIKRGLWLILIEVVVMNLALTFNPFYNLVFLEVIWAIGISMIILGILVWLPLPVIFITGLCIVCGHNLLDHAEAARSQSLGFWWSLIHGKSAAFPFAPGHVLVIAYSFLSWTGIMLMGYCAGTLFTANVPSVTRRKILLVTGTGMIILFIILRWINMYGNPSPWEAQQNSLRTFFSFMNVNKYPPSLQFVCITIGPALLVLALVENIQNRFTAFVQVYGRVPLFYFVTHFFIIHLLTLVIFFLSGYGVKDIIPAKAPFFFRPLDFGFNLWIVYVIWIGIVLIMYPLCKWYNRYKSTHDYWWLSYL